MKILKIFGAVVGIHLFALVLIFANPGCSSTSKPPPAPIDTVAKAEPSPAITVPSASTSITVPAGGGSPVAAAPINFNPDAPAGAAPVVGIRFSPTRPNTPAAATLVAEPVADVTPAAPYVVKAGDSLWSIANKNHLSVPDLAAVNSLKVGAVLQPGQKLIIPGKAPAHAMTSLPASKPAGEPAAAKAPPADAVKYTVKSGESLSVIAKTFGVKPGDLAVANNITDPQKLRAGTVLVIPGGGWQAPAAKTSRSTAKPAAATTPKPATEPIKPLITTPAPADADSPIKVAPTTPPAEGPVIKVDEPPAPKKP